MNIDQKISTTLGIDNLPEDARQRIINNTKSILQIRLMLLIDEMLTDEQRVEFEQMKDQQDFAATMLWIDNNVVNTDEVYGKLLDDYLAEKKELLDSVAG